jgi:hypothetical protein
MIVATAARDRHGMRATGTKARNRLGVDIGHRGASALRGFTGEATLHMGTERGARDREERERQARCT